MRILLTNIHVGQTEEKDWGEEEDREIERETGKEGADE